MILVDSVTGVGGAAVLADAWQLDFTLTGSQKALALPAGLGLAVASERYLLQAESLSDRGQYFDVVQYESAALRQETPNTPALSLLYALQRQLRDIAAEGLEARWARHAALRERTIAWAERATADGLIAGIVAREGARSPTVTALRLEGTIRDADVDRAMQARGFTIGRGYGALAGRTVRIGHMGDHTVAGLAPFLDALDESLRELRATQP
jgi:aspartate aminotransferase-like enzyme